MLEPLNMFGLFLREVNAGYADLLLLVVATLTFWFVYKEYVLKRRPFIFPELIFEKEDDDWYFHFILKNAGRFPALTKIQMARLTIGDEVYPTQFSTETLVPAAESNKLVPIGHIKKNGRDKIVNHEYKNNRVEIDFEIASKPVGTKKYKYFTAITYEVDVKGDVPVIKVVSEEFS